MSTAMKNSKVLSALLIVLAVGTPAFAQGANGYHYNYGTSRVINQGSVGYYQHGTTYIPTGSINNTAKGIVTGGIGQEANPSLPGVKWGRTVGTSGDNFYLGGAPDKYKTAVPTYAQTPQRTLIMGGNKGGQQQQVIYQQPQQQQQQRGYLYVPGQNGGAASYANTGSTGYQYNNSGAATYESVNTNSKGR